MIGNVSTFLKEAIQCWLCFQFHPPESRDEILQQIIWFNSNILVEGKPIFWNKVFDHGILFINDIVDEDGKLMKYSQFIEMYDTICSPHPYNQLISAIGRDWKQKINSGMSKSFVCQPSIRNRRWLKGNKIKWNYVYILFNL